MDTVARRKKKEKRMHNRLMYSRENALISAREAPKEEDRKRQGKIKRDKERGGK